MNTKEVKAALENCEDGEVFEVTLKNGDRLQCQSNPKRSKVEVAAQQSGQNETYYRGDVINPREIEEF